MTKSILHKMLTAFCMLWLEHISTPGTTDNQVDIMAVHETWYVYPRHMELTPSAYGMDGRRIKIEVSVDDWQGAIKP